MKRIIDLKVAIKMWTKQLGQIRKLILPVVANICLTLAGWIGVYEMKIDENNYAFYMLDSKKNLTTGNDLYDGMLNGVSSICMLALISFLMLALALYNFKRIVKSWLSFSCILIMFGVFSGFCNDALKSFGIEDENFVICTLMTSLYGGLGSIVFFTCLTPLWLHQSYVITNCSLVSIFYLRTFPVHTAWFVLTMIVGWDLFAVLAPSGPLRMVTEKAGEYSDSVLRMLMFEAHEEAAECLVETAETEGENAQELESSRSSESEVRTADSFDVAECKTNDDEDKTEMVVLYEGDNEDDVVFVQYEQETGTNPIASRERKTAMDALEDSGTVHLGMGDFVFYSVLVGKAAVSGSIIATVSAALGVIVGLFLTLCVLSHSDSTCPALPVSVVFGMGLHFSTLYLLEPFLASLPHTMIL